MVKKMNSSPFLQQKGPPFQGGVHFTKVLEQRLGGLWREVRKRLEVGNGPIPGNIGL